MARVDVPVRAPVGLAWLTTVAGIILTGELYYEAHNKAIVHLFRAGFNHDEVAPFVWIMGLGTVAAASWLALHYIRPGRLILDAERGTVRRERRRRLRMIETDAAATQWHAVITYFSRQDQARGVFKRLQLSGPAGDEVLLYTDVPDGAKLAHGLEAMADQLGSLVVEVENELQNKVNGPLATGGVGGEETLRSPQEGGGSAVE